MALKVRWVDHPSSIVADATLPSAVEAVFEDGFAYFMDAEEISQLILPAGRVISVLRIEDSDA